MEEVTQTKDIAQTVTAPFASDKPKSTFSASQSETDEPKPTSALPTSQTAFEQLPEQALQHRTEDAAQTKDITQTEVSSSASASDKSQPARALPIFQTEFEQMPGQTLEHRAGAAGLTDQAVAAEQRLRDRTSLSLRPAQHTVLQPDQKPERIIYRQGSADRTRTGQSFQGIRTITGNTTGNTAQRQNQPVTILKPVTGSSTKPAAKRLLTEKGEELTYLSTGAAEDKKRPEKKAQTEDSYFGTLPDWAKRFLQQPNQGKTGQSMQSRSQQTTAPNQRMEWTAPQVLPEAAQLVFPKREEKTGPQQPQQWRLSDRELRRAADQVYRIIEDRLRREFRRSGR